MKSNAMSLTLLVILVIAVVYFNCGNENEGLRRERYADVYYKANLDPSINKQTFAATNPNNAVNTQSQHVVGVSNDSFSGAIRGKINPKFTNKEGFGTQDDRLMAGRVFDAPQYVKPKNADYFATAGQPAFNSYPSEYDVIGPDFANMANQNKMKDVATYRAAAQGSKPDPLTYNTPSDLLPTPDMRQPLMKDPSNPINFMYDRTVFAPLKTRNHNSPDRIRGDLDINPIKTGWFDVATNPSTDLAKGYFGLYTDIQEYQDIQDIVYNKIDTSNPSNKLQDSAQINQILTSIDKELTKPSLKYAKPARTNANPNNPFGNMMV